MKVLVWKMERGPVATGLVSMNLPGSLDSLDNVSGKLPGGAYTTFRTFGQHSAIRLLDHIERLKETALLAGHPVVLDENIVRAALRATIRQAQEQLLERAEGEATSASEFRLRLTVDLEQEIGDIYVAIEKLPVPSVQSYCDGVRVITVEMERALPRAKLTRFIDRAAPVRRSLPQDVNDAIMVDGAGRLMEGLSSNFFAVHSGRIKTAGEGVLAGITRTLVLEAVAELAIPIDLEPIRFYELEKVDECFITSSSRGLLPVIQVDEIVIGSGKPGPISSELMACYEAKVQAQLSRI